MCASRPGSRHPVLLTSRESCSYPHEAVSMLGWSEWSIMNSESRRRRSEGRRRRFALVVSLQVPAVEWDNSVPAAIERRRCRSEGRRRRSMRVRVVDVAQRAVDVVSLWSSLCKFRLSKRVILFHFPVSWPTVPFDLLLTFVQINL